ncbi:hypothetical protein L208DRAFT_1399900 [Tricholoma matsutake]|nr:hypothetical protein L208DRAFT_1399900 [Tricholoma matsutake 945]
MYCRGGGPEVHKCTQTKQGCNWGGVSSKGGWKSDNVRGTVLSQPSAGALKYQLACIVEEEASKCTRCTQTAWGCYWGGVLRRGGRKRNKDGGTVLSQPFMGACDQCARFRTQPACIVEEGAQKCTRCTQTKQGCYWSGVSRTGHRKGQKGKRNKVGGMTSGL